VANQPEVEEVPEGLHPEDGNPNASREEYRMGRSERPHSVVLGNHDEWVDHHKEIATNYVELGESYHRKTTIVDTYFASKIADSLDSDPEPKSMTECWKRSDWDKWKATIEAELRSLCKREVFGPAVPTPPNVIPVGCKWVFLQKRNEHGQVVRCKVRLVAQGFTQRPDINYDETYSPVMSGITFRYLIFMAANLNLKMQLMDVVTAYLYGSLDSEIHMRVPEGLKIPGLNQNRNMFSVRLQWSLYGLKQSGRMWFNRLSNFLLQRGYINNDDCPCVFIKKSCDGFCIISVYVNDLNIIGMTRDIEEAMAYLKTEFEMKDLGKTKFCLGLQLEHLPEGVFVHQFTYTKRVLENFNMDGCHPLRTPMIVRSLEADKDPFRPNEEDEQGLGPEVPYLSAIGALMYLANCTRPDIAFAVSVGQVQRCTHQKTLGWR
jgi:hypothetical protein